MNINNWPWKDLVILARKLGLNSIISVAKSIKRKYPGHVDKQAKARILIKRQIRLKLKED